MAKWNERYFVTELKKNIVEAPWSPMFTQKEASRLLSLDSDVREGAFYMEMAWFWPGKWPDTKSDEGTVKPHSHEFDESIAFVGTNPADIHDLGGEVELWVNGEQNVLDKSFVAFLPAGTVHGPLIIRKVNRPIFHFTCGFGKQYF
jgi:hypothetical protein